MALLGGLDGRDDFHGKGANTPAGLPPVNGLLEEIESILFSNKLDKLAPGNFRGEYPPFAGKCDRIGQNQAN